MSLVVGLVEQGLTYLVGDTALTFGGKRTSPYIEGCLKQYIVTPNLAIGFAGCVTDFEKVSANILSSNTADAITGIALEAQQSGLDFDLLVAKNGSPLIRKICGGTIERAPFLYVGDQQAFNALKDQLSQQATNRGIEGRGTWGDIRLPEPIIENSNYGRLLNALKEIVENSHFPSVGGVIVPLCTDKGKFTAMNYFGATSDILDTSKFNGEPFAIDFGTAEGGGFTIEFSGEHDPDNPNSVGFYFLQGKFGLYFLPNANGLREAVIVRAENAPLWTRETQKLLGKAIPSGFAGTDACGIAGEQMFKAGKWDDALYCYELGFEKPHFADTPQKRDRYI